MSFDEDALVAAAHLVGRSGARGFTVGDLHDDPKNPDQPHPTKPGWYALAQYRGARITSEDHRDPVAAAEALVRRLFEGAVCRRCGNPIVLNDHDDGCRWTRVGKRWEPGCDLPIDQSIPMAPR